jgi:uncharacterized membrane protein YphA (DoxX/SURF4 family)
MNYSSTYYKPGKKSGFDLGNDGSAGLQILSVILNTLSVFFIALALLDHLDGWFAYLGLGLFLTSLLGLSYTKSWPLMVYVSRVLVGGLFIVSGMIKANDPEGFSYKLHDYFQKNALDLESWNDAAIYLAIIIAVGEIVLGFAVLVGGKMRITSWTLLLLILFFGWLTFYTSTCLEKQTAYGDTGQIIESADKSLNTTSDPQEIVDATYKYEYVDDLISELGGIYEDSLRVGWKKKVSWANAISKELLVVKGDAEKFDDLSDNSKAKIENIIGQYHPQIQAHLEANPIPPFWRQCVDDCGCFGDAMKGSVGRSLLPWESFGKDAVLLYFVLIIFFFQGRIKLNSDVEDVWLLSSSIVLMLFLCWVFNWYFTILFSIILFGIYIFIKRMEFGRLGPEWMYAIIVTAAATFVGVYTYTYLPLKDYRAYAVGNDLVQQMQNGVKEESEMTYIRMHRQTHEIKEFTDKYYWKDDNWKWIEEEYLFLNGGKQVTVEGRLPSLSPGEAFGGAFIHYGQLPEFIQTHPIILEPFMDTLENPIYKILYMPEYDQNDTVLLEDYRRDLEYYPDSSYQDKGNYQKPPEPSSSVALEKFIMGYDKVLVVVVRVLDDVYEADLDGLAELTKTAQENGIAVIGLTTADDAAKSKFLKENKLDFPMATGDDTELKIVVRSNPGIVLLKNKLKPNGEYGSSIVKGKWSSRSIPNYERIKELLEE